MATEQSRTTAGKVMEALAELPMIDIHTHLVAGRLGARGLHDILLYHFVVSDLYGAGCPSGKRLTEYPGFPTLEEGHQRVQEALPYLQYIRNTHVFWGVRTILRDLYNWNEPITASNWKKLDAIIRERSDDRAWHYSVVNKLNIQRSSTELARRWGKNDDNLFQYTLEWGMFARCQWGEFDTALYDLERTWGRPPESPAPIGTGARPATQRVIRSLADVHAAIKHYVSVIPTDMCVSMATHISTDITYRNVTDAEMEAAIARRGQAGESERDIYVSYIQEHFLSELEAKLADKLVYQFSFAAEPLPYETGSFMRQDTLRQVAEMIGRHSKLRFQCFVASRHADQTLCTMARELPNLSLAGVWWHNFNPDAMRQVMCQRLDMVPVNKHVGFFSDAYCIEWTYGKAFLIRKQLACVLAQKIEQGQYSFEDAISIARSIVYETPQTFNGFKPQKQSV